MMEGAATKAVVLAAGRGTRMMREEGAFPEEGVALDAEQERAASLGLKALIPFHGRPYLAYSLHQIADAGIREVCIVVRPGEDPVRACVERMRGDGAFERLNVSFAVQREPRGTADALLAAESFAGGEPVVVLNGDNLYPAEVIERVRRLGRPGLAGFRARALTGLGNIPAERMVAFALLSVDDGGRLDGIIEKPGADAMSRAGSDPLVSMTCWRFGPEIFDACRKLEPSARGEYELPDAVLALKRGGVSFQVVPVEVGVLDLTGREDIPGVAARLAGREVWL